MGWRQVAIGAGFLVVGAGQFLLSQTMVAQHGRLRHWPPVSITPFTDFVADPSGFSVRDREAGCARFGPRTGDEVVAVDGAPFQGMASYLRRYWRARPQGEEFTMTFRGPAGGEWTWANRPIPCTTCGYLGELWLVSICGILPFFCLGAAWLVAAQQPRSQLAWAYAGLMLSLSQISLWLGVSERFELVGSPMGWEEWYRIPVLATQTFLQSAWPAFLLLGAGVFRPLGWLGRALVAAFLLMAGIEARLAVAWSEDFRPWAGVYAALTECGTELALLGMAGIAAWIWTADRWLGVLAGLITVAAGVILFSAPEALRGYEWILYSDDSRRLTPLPPAYPMTPACVGLLATAAMLLAAMLRAGRHMPLALLGAWLLFVPLATHVGAGLAGYPEFLRVPFVDDWIEWMLTAAGAGVVLTGRWVCREASAPNAKATAIS